MEAPRNVPIILTRLLVATPIPPARTRTPTALAFIPRVYTLSIATVGPVFYVRASASIGTR
jgi:hypothetical protein